MTEKASVRLVKTLKSLRFLFLLVALIAQSSPSVSAHGGGLDGDGGHNCYLGSCAGTYHYHRGGGGSSSSSNFTLPALCVSLNTSSKFTQREIALIQFKLLLNGISPGPIDGYGGRQTQRAGNAYESRYGLQLSPKNSIYHRTVIHLDAEC